MKNSLVKKQSPLLISVGAFVILIFLYFYPVLNGKVLLQSDIIQVQGSLKESNDFHSKTGEEILWSNSTFAGMPVWRGHNKNLLIHIHAFLCSAIPLSILISLLYFIGFWVLLYALEVNVWLRFAGSIAYTFSTFNMISLEAGHINKVFAMALMAPVLGGIILTYKRKWLLGAAVTTLFLTFHIFYNHIQISYYLLFIIFLLTLTQLYTAYKTKTIPDFVKASAILAGCLLLAIAPNVSRLWTTMVYAKSTPRAGSELSTKKSEGDGLDKDYAFAWSNGIAETMTIMIPGFYGGSSHEDVGQNSNIYKSLIKNGVAKKEARDYSKAMPLYWGDQQFTSGPVYFGAVICFLFVLALFLVKGSLKWWTVAAAIISIVLSWGKNFELINDFFFYYFPMYNKFRSVTMILCIAQLTVPALALAGLSKAIMGESKQLEVLNAIKKSFYITGGIVVFFALLGTSVFDFTSANDAALQTQMPEWLMAALREDREAAFRGDAIRSFIFILLSAALLWFYSKGKLKLNMLYLGFSLLILIDMWGIDKRYLNADDFKYNKNSQDSFFVASAADEEILKDKDPNFKVFNTTTGITGDAITSYFHKSIGGYSAIKLRRYQEIIDSSLSRGNAGVFNMLNTKYFIVQDKATGQLSAQRNPEALGNAWFVNKYSMVNNADEEINAIKSFDPSQLAIVDKRFAAQLNGLKPNADVGKITFISYHPHILKYKSESTGEGLAIFSEVFYEPGWNAYIDGKLIPHLRANYILRGLRIPAGSHEIIFKFEPVHYYTGENISLAGSVILVLFLLFVFIKQGADYLKRSRIHS